MWCSFNIMSVATKPPVMNQAVNLIINRESHSFFRGEINNFHLVQSPIYDMQSYVSDMQGMTI